MGSKYYSVEVNIILLTVQKVKNIQVPDLDSFILYRARTDGFKMHNCLLFVLFCTTCHVQYGSFGMKLQHTAAALICHIKELFKTMILEILYGN